MIFSEPDIVASSKQEEEVLRKSLEKQYDYCDLNTDYTDKKLSRALLSLSNGSTGLDPDEMMERYNMLDDYFIDGKNTFYAWDRFQLLKMMIRFYLLYQGLLGSYLEKVELAGTKFLVDSMNRITCEDFLQTSMDLFYYAKIPRHSVFRNLRDLYHYLPFTSFSTTTNVLQEAGFLNLENGKHREILLSYVIQTPSGPNIISFGSVVKHVCSGATEVKHACSGATEGSIPRVLLYCTPGFVEKILVDFYENLNEVSETQMCIHLLLVHKRLNPEQKKRIYKLILESFISKSLFYGIAFMFKSCHLSFGIKEAYMSLPKQLQFKVLHTLLLDTLDEWFNKKLQGETFMIYDYIFNLSLIITPEISLLAVIAALKDYKDGTDLRKLITVFSEFVANASLNWTQGQKLERLEYFLYEFLDAFIDGPGETKHRRLQVFLTAFESMEDQKRLLVEFVTKSVLSWGKKHGYKKTRD
ncbi:hypothetical protein MP638_005485 [Amoeboaphelidium occidentale]|nr:hypothetical protein MP638_005485 [Amoeboaphelidium occidentale]